MRTNALRIAAAIVFAAVAVVAHAATEAQVSADASALLADYQDLDQRVDACPDGECEDAPDILSTFDELETRRGQLHADFQTLPPSPTLWQVAAAISQVDQIAGSLQAILGGWTEG
jgi:hypothetical protein